MKLKDVQQRWIGQFCFSEEGSVVLVQQNTDKVYDEIGPVNEKTMMGYVTLGGEFWGTMEELMEKEVVKFWLVEGTLWIHLR